MKLVMDTNFVMEVARNKIDLERELKRIMEYPYELYIISGTREELKKIAEEQKGKDRGTAKLALEMIKDVKTLEVNGKNVDEKLVDVSDKNTIIATQDRELKKKIKGRIIVVRQKKYLKLI